MTLPRLEIDHESVNPPAFEQIRRQVTALVEAGALAEGERLPPVRALAADLGLAVNTVARAYRELESDGVVTTAGRAGTVVAAGSQRDDVALRRAAEAFVARAAVSGLSEAEALDWVRSAFRRLST
ncbi:MAG TPA: GntR family transcriptional regulator [Pedococcus sp.]|jgi:DNA-binding transcriptional regulator YhcF (GntR family)|uniref:GntR family transcriptional regulator n=1 Tax=Pedococcus sp. TaxID=2860345 RepID=UPI002F946B4A